MVIKKFNPNWCQGFMEEDDCGNYVYEEDYESLEADYQILRRDYQALVDKIGDVYREA